MLIFDLDGTLWNTTMTTLEAANEISKKYDDVKKFSIETIESGMGLSAEENSKNFMPYLEQEKALFYLSEINKKNIEIVSQNDETLYDNVKDVIRKLSKKYKLGIITNNNNEYVEAFFKASDLKDCFSDYMGALSYSMTKGEAIKDMITRNKEPDSFYVGDIKKDMESTEEAGINFIHAKYGFEPTLKSKYSIEDINELEGLLDEIE